VEFISASARLHDRRRQSKCGEKSPDTRNLVIQEGLSQAGVNRRHPPAGTAGGHRDFRTSNTDFVDDSSKHCVASAHPRFFFEGDDSLMLDTRIRRVPGAMLLALCSLSCEASGTLADEPTTLLPVAPPTVFEQPNGAIELPPQQVFGEIGVTAVQAADPSAAAPPQAPFIPPVRPLEQGEVSSIDLAGALALAGVRNSDLLIARQRVVEAAALRQLAAVQILPNLNLGFNYSDHTGAIQQSSGNIIELHRQALYVGAGANAVGAGTVNVPGLQYNLNVSQSIFAYLTARQSVRTQELGTRATQNDVLLRVALAYLELLRAECLRAISIQIRDDAAEIGRLTDNFARTGEGRRSDANRAATELEQRESELLEIESQVLVASARLAQLLNLDPSIRLHAVDGWVVPAPVVPEPITLPELLSMAMVARPELASQRSAVQETLLQLNAARMLPFSPQFVLGLSAGGFGGGSNRQDLGAQSNFSSLDDRTDFDVVMFWTLQNMGFGNRAQIEAARARLSAGQFQRLAVLDRVRFEVAAAHARTQARFARLTHGEQAVAAASEAFREDLTRIRSREGLPIEVLDSLRLLGRARTEYLNTVIEYNRAHFELYTALGQPPADLLARPVPAELVPPLGEVVPNGTPNQ
jgi:outer membrane protein TolC